MSNSLTRPESLGPALPELMIALPNLLNIWLNSTLESRGTYTFVTLGLVRLADNLAYLKKGRWDGHVPLHYCSPIVALQVGVKTISGIPSVPEIKDIKSKKPQGYVYFCYILYTLGKHTQTSV